MNLRQLTYFKKLAELQHYTKASSELFISQPSLSYAISSLEQELGTPLFQKQGRNVVLTKYGKEFYRHVSKGLTEIETGVQLLKKHSSVETGHIDMGVIPTMTGDFMPRMIQEYLTVHPQTDFQIFPNYTKEVIEGVRNGTYDLGICSMDENESSLVYIPVFIQNFVVIARKDHEFAQKEWVDPEELEDHPFMTYRPALPIGKAVRNMFQEHQVVPDIIRTFDDETTIGGMVHHNFGMAVVADTPLLRQFDLAVIPIHSPLNHRIIYLAHHKDRFLTDSVSAFISYMTEKAKASISSL
ncbi:LysR family transcriptional regulator [Aminipila butyrica]|uniref:LysR family transcriptional regulator n=1 Tax=Aminipila butyrica TaxID=433296 RepID=A0A858BT55_9FIRM|nr:LysR family transcriptional regulator [Aminipila butyrica]QIB67954.1 LysR family transcriptional regulator [Aminipila butyrica]